MTAATTACLPEVGANPPKRGTYGSAANSHFQKACIVVRDANGRAAVPTDGDGLPALGIAAAYYDNRTGSEAGGSADDLDVEVEYGVFSFATSGTAPLPGELAYVVDNQTVSADPTAADGSQRGIAGWVVQTFTKLGISYTMVWMVPGHAGAGAARGHISVPFTQTAFSDGVTNGIDATVFGFRMNNVIDDQPMTAIVQLPNDLDTSKDVYVRARAYIIDDAVDNDVVMVLVARVDGGADIAPVSTDVLGEAPAQTISFALPNASIAAGAKALWLEIDCADTLDTSDAVLLGLEIDYSRLVG